MDAQLRKAFQRQAAEEAAAKAVVTYSRPISLKKSTSSISSDENGNGKDEAEVTKEDMDSVLAAKPSVIIVSNPQATETIEASSAELYLVHIISPNLF